MDRRWLQEELDGGRSLEAIAREVGKHPSTVGYWVAKHGLRANGAERYARRGAPDELELRRLAATGATLKELAASLDRSPSTVRYWLDR